MRRPRTRWFALAALVVVLAGAGGVIWYVFGGSSPAKPHLSGTATTDVAAGSSTPDGGWALVRGKNIYVGYRMQEQFAGDTIQKEAVGRSGTVTGAMTIASGEVTTAVVTADLRSLSSDRAARDDYIHSHGIESDRFPTARFELSAPLALPGGVRPGRRLHLNAAGALTLHGVTRPVTVALDTRWNGSTIDLVGTAPIVLADYGIQPPKTSVTSVGDRGSFELQLRFRHTG